VIDPQEVASRVASIRDDISQLASHSVSIVAVTKTFSTDAWAAAQAAGCDGIGENYAQELLEKIERMPAPLPLHFIGAIQSNKVRALAPHVALWHGVDRESVITEISKRAPGASILLQVNTTGEESKSGMDPTHVDRLRTFAEEAGLRVSGLMTLGPTHGTAAEIRASFTALRTIADEHHLYDCSMGMSGDYKIGLECGSTIIRIGSMLFGERNNLVR
jgi:pyridoxal phosphate enzyme (YggS family)